MEIGQFSIKSMHSSVGNSLEQIHWYPPGMTFNNRKKIRWTPYNSRAKDWKRIKQVLPEFILSVETFYSV